MNVAILYNPKPESDSTVVDDAYEEYDDEVTIAAIGRALAGLGVNPVPVVANRDFPGVLARGQFDFVFNLAEGAGGRCREAVPAAVCEFLGLPTTGSDVLTLAATLDKAVARRLVSPEIPVARAVVIAGAEDEVGLETLTYPVVVKPNHEGSSKGIWLDSWCADLGAASDRCRWLRERYGGPVLVEEFLPGTEVTVGIRGNGRNARIIGLMEIAPCEPGRMPFLYSLEAKRDFRRRIRYHVPPRLPVAHIHTLRSYALSAYRVLGCRDVARIDFRLDAACRPHFLECNPLPGLHPESSDLVILARAATGDDEHAYDQLVQGILRDAARRCGMRLPGPE